MSVYAENLLRELVARGHDVTMCQPVPRRRGRHRGLRRRPAAGRPGARRRRGVARRSASRGRDGASPPTSRPTSTRCRGRSLRPARRAARSTSCTPSTATRPGSRCCRRARRPACPTVVSHPGRRRALGRHLLHAPTATAITRRARPRRRAADRQRRRSRRGRAAATAPTRSASPSCRAPPTPARFTPVDRRRARLPTRRCCSTTAASTAGRACSTCWRPPALLADGCVRLVVSGIGPDLDAGRATRRGLDGRVDVPRLHAARRTRREVYRAADVFVTPTYAEGFTNTILEAMASGLPVVSAPTASASSTACATARTALLARARRRRRRCAAGARAGCSTTRALRRRLAADRRCEEVRRLYSWPVRRPRSIDGRLRGRWPAPRRTSPGRCRPPSTRPAGSAPRRTCCDAASSPSRPHLDDAAFSVGGDPRRCSPPPGTRCACVTCFTAQRRPTRPASRWPARLDKGLAPGRRLHGAAPRRGRAPRWRVARRRAGAPAAARGAAPRLRPARPTCSPACTPTTTSAGPLADALARARARRRPRASRPQAHRRPRRPPAGRARRRRAAAGRRCGGATAPYVLREPDASPWPGCRAGSSSPSAIAAHLGTRPPPPAPATPPSWASSSAGPTRWRPTWRRWPGRRPDGSTPRSRARCSSEPR